MRSKLHSRVLEMILICPVFTGQAIREEVAVSELFPDYNNNRDRYDIVIPGLHIVVEVHGQQHEKITTWSSNEALGGGYAEAHSL